jgi:hypothetical protein
MVGVINERERTRTSENERERQLLSRSYRCRSPSLVPTR